jgi:hypothetical protein
VPLLGSRSVIGSQLNGDVEVNAFSLLRVGFSAPVTAITVAFGDAGGDDDSPVLISAYDASVAATLSGTFADADYFVLTSGPHTANSNSDSIYWEVPDVTFASSTPEPGTLGAALLGVVVRFRLRIAANRVNQITSSRIAIRTISPIESTASLVSTLA